MTVSNLCCRFFGLLIIIMSKSTNSQQQQHQEGDATTGVTTPTVAYRVLLPIESQPFATAAGAGLDVMDEEEKFLYEFERQVIDLVRQFSRQFPYKQSVIWSIEYAEDKQYCIQVMSNKYKP